MDDSDAEGGRKMVGGTYAERGGVEEHAGVLALVEERVRDHRAVGGGRAAARVREAERVAYMHIGIVGCQRCGPLLDKMNRAEGRTGIAADVVALALREVRDRLAVGVN